MYQIVCLMRDWHIIAPNVQFPAYETEHNATEIVILGKYDTKCVYELHREIGSDKKYYVMRNDLQGLHLALPAGFLTTTGTYNLQLRGTYEDGSVKISNEFKITVNRFIAAEDSDDPEAPTVLDQIRSLVATYTGKISELETLMAKQVEVKDNQLRLTTYFNEGNNNGDGDVLAYNEYLNKLFGDWMDENLDDSAIVLIDKSLMIEDACADAKATGDAIRAVQGGLNTQIEYSNNRFTAVERAEALVKSAFDEEVTQINSGRAVMNQSDIFDDTIYANAGGVMPYSNAITYMYEIKPGKKYTVLNKKESSCAFGISNTLYSGAYIDVGQVFSSSTSNTITFTNANNYQYLYITKNNGTVDREIYVMQELSDVFVGDEFIASLEVSKEHLRKLADENIPKTDNSYVVSTTGELVTGTAGFKSTGYIDLQGFYKIVLLMPVLTSSATGAGLAFYNTSKTYLSGIDCNVSSAGGSETRIIDVPSNAKYIRVSCRDEAWSDFFVKADDVYVNEKAIEILNAKTSQSLGVQMFEKIGVIGDSISVGWAKDKNGNNSRRNTGISWVQQMARRLGCTAYNLGASGVDPIEWFQTNYEFYEYCYPQYVSVGACDLYIIGLGLNYGTLGSVSDINQSDYTQNGATFYGQYARMIQMINDEHPGAIVMCLTEPTTEIASYDQAVRDICALNYINAELVDLERNYYSLFNTPEILAEHQPDGLHFTPYGYSLIAKAMENALNDYISKNTSHFKYVGVASVT